LQSLKLPEKNENTDDYDFNGLDVGICLIYLAESSWVFWTMSKARIVM
jgi:hypothetical protein